MRSDEILMPLAESAKDLEPPTPRMLARRSSRQYLSFLARAMRQCVFHPHLPA